MDKSLAFAMYKFSFCFKKKHCTALKENMKGYLEIRTLRYVGSLVPPLQKKVWHATNEYT